MKVTRDVVSDLWPLYAAGEASADTRALVDDFLAGDEEFARALRHGVDLPAIDLSLPPDEEARALARTRELVHGGGRWLHAVRVLALTLTVLAIVRFPQETTEYFVVRIVIAGVAWSLYLLLRSRQRARALGGFESDGAVRH